jgi:lipopolysaccharide/colanic/teichoic acid biosynthesis glycosyltransferase
MAVRVRPPRSVRRPARSALRATLKRAFDVVVAAVILAVSLPLLALIALVIVLDSPGPVFYRGTRAGFRGRQLQMLKFRKMRRDADGTFVTLARDERFTRVGAWLARTKLDELPQLWHVLRGDMSLVGPRPESLACVEQYPADYELILSVRPGITGYTQLAFCREGAILDPHDPERHYLVGLLPQKIALDRFYAEHASLWTDLRILAATLVTLVFRQPVAVDRTTGRLTARRRPAQIERHVIVAGAVGGRDGAHDDGEAVPPASGRTGEDGTSAPAAHAPVALAGTRPRRRRWRGSTRSEPSCRAR